MKITKFEIEFDSHQGVFNAGTSVTGKVLLNLDKPLKMRSLKLYFVGQGKSHWRKKNGKKKIHYRGNETYMNAVMRICGAEADSGSIEHPAGNHEYPFTLQLSPQLPSSFEGTRGYVRYFCKATIDRPWKFNSNVKRAFTVIHHLDLNSISEATVPIHGQQKKDLEGCCCSAGSVEISMTLNKTGYVPGEPVVYDLFLDNQSDYRIVAADLILIQIVTYKGFSDSIFSSGHPKYHPKQTSFSLHHQTCNILKGTTDTINRATAIPSLPPSNLEGCDIISIDYQIKFKVSLDAAFGEKLEIVRNIIIGTVPVQEPVFQPPTQPSAPVFATTPEPYAGGDTVAPVTSQPESINLLDRLPSYEEALAPPPSYAECVYGRTAIRDDDDDTHTTGDVTWAPAYPYYDYSTLRRGQQPALATAGPPQDDDDDEDEEG